MEASEHEAFLKSLFPNDKEKQESVEHLEYRTQEAVERGDIDRSEVEEVHKLEKAFYTDAKAAKEQLATLKKSVEVNDQRLFFLFQARQKVLTDGYGDIKLPSGMPEYQPGIPRSEPTDGGRKRKTRRRRSTRKLRRRKTLAKKK